MYDQEPKIHVNFDNEIEAQDVQVDSQAEWCPNPAEVSALSRVREPDQFREFYGSAKRDFKIAKLHSDYKIPQINSLDPPEELPGFQAKTWEDNYLGVDMRPHVYDEALGKFLLIDSGSECTAFPPDPGDQPVPGKFLKAVNGSKIKCYGLKDISIKIGRKEYNCQAIKADVDHPVLGWDFVRKHKLDLVWNEYGDNCLVDKIAKITTILKYKSMPHNASSAHRKLAEIHPFTKRKGRVGDKAQ